MSPIYESTIYCAQPKKVLKEIMQEAVNQYLHSNPKASLIENNSESITLKIPINLKSWGEILKVSVEEESFYIMSKCSAFFQLVAWGRNRNNFNAICMCLENAIANRNRQ